MSRNNDDALFSLALILTVLLLLASVAVVFLILEALRRLLRGPAQGDGQRAVSLFGAPASSWWIETYERWLWRLEEVTGANFTSSPERIFSGSMLLAAGVGGSGAALSGMTVYVVAAAAGVTSAAVPAFAVGFFVFLGALVICGLSVWALSQPARGWWEIARGDASGQVEDEKGGFVLGHHIGEE
jgi:hypothetical protein